MPTFREDLHLGHKVPLVETDDIVNGAITTDKLGDGSVTTPKIADGAVTTPKLANSSVTTIKIADGAVTTPKIADGAVTPEKLSGRIIPEVIYPVLEPLRKKDADLQNQINSLQVSGIALSNMFGDDPYIGICQKTLTEAFNRIWSKLEDITGEAMLGISMTVSPEYFIGEDGCTVNIKASTVDTAGIFEHIAFYINGELITEADNVDYLEYNISLYDTSVIKCVAKVLGIEYIQQKTITHYNSFWVGAGTNYRDIMNVSHVIPITEGMRGSHDVTCKVGDYIYVVIGESLMEGFTRADMNGVEIQFTESTVTISGVKYKVFKSVNTYQAGTYNIDINS